MRTIQSKLVKVFCKYMFFFSVYSFQCCFIFWPMVVAHRQATEGIVTQATVQGREYVGREPGVDNWSIDYWRYELEYEGHHGTLKSRRDYESGTKVFVVYLKEHPDRAVVGTAQDSWWQLYLSNEVYLDDHEVFALIVIGFWVLVLLVLPVLVVIILCGRWCYQRLGGHQGPPRV